MKKRRRHRIGRAPVGKKKPVGWCAFKKTTRVVWDQMDSRARAHARDAQVVWLGAFFWVRRALLLLLSIGERGRAFGVFLFFVQKGGWDGVGVHSHFNRRRQKGGEGVLVLFCGKIVLHRLKIFVQRGRRARASGDG
jgi:hypothetical protein